MITNGLHLRQTSAGQVQLGLRSGWQSAKSKAQSASTIEPTRRREKQNWDIMVTLLYDHPQRRYHQKCSLLA